MLKVYINTLLSTPVGISLLSVLTCLCFYYLKSEKNSFRKITQAIYFLVFSYALYSFSSRLNYRLHSFQVWDFTSFYLWGKVAVQGKNFYLPENSQIVFNSMIFPDTNLNEFIYGIVNVGFLYPPPTMLYFVLLGYLPYNYALLVWTIFILFLLFACIYLVYNQYFNGEGLYGLMLVSILFLIYPSVNETIQFSQTNFLVLFYLLLMKKHSDNKLAGVFLALAFFVKPYMLIFGVLFLFTKNWKAVFYFLLSSVLLSIFTIVLFGADTFMSYFSNNPAKRIPAWQYSEQINQSLHAVLIRAGFISIDKPSSYIIIVTALFSIVIVSLTYLYKKQKYDFMWSLLLLVTLLIYPGTLSYYGVSLLFIVFWFFNSDHSLGLKFYLVVPIIGIFYYLISVSLFSSICFLLIIVIFNFFWHSKKHSFNLM